MSNQDIKIEDQLNIFDSDEEKVIYTADKFLEKKKNQQLFDYASQNINILKIYYQNFFIEKLVLDCWLYIDKFCYRNCVFLTVDNLLLQMKIDFSYLCTVRIYLLCPASNSAVIEKLADRNDQSIIYELQQIVNSILSHYENKN